MCVRVLLHRSTWFFQMAGHVENKMAHLSRELRTQYVVYTTTMCITTATTICTVRRLDVAHDVRVWLHSVYVCVCLCSTRLYIYICLCLIITRVHRRPDIAQDAWVNTYTHNIILNLTCNATAHSNTYTPQTHIQSLCTTNQNKKSLYGIWCALAIKLSAVPRLLGGLCYKMRSTRHPTCDAKTTTTTTRVATDLNGAHEEVDDMIVCAMMMAIAETLDVVAFGGAASSTLGFFLFIGDHIVMMSTVKPYRTRRVRGVLRSSLMRDI